MTCKFCGSPLAIAVHLPTEAGGVYTFVCGTVYSTENEPEWSQSRECKENR